MAASWPGTGVARCVDQTTPPVLADSAYTVSFSVATYTMPPDTRGSPYSFPSRAGEVHARAEVFTELTGPPWYTV